MSLAAASRGGSRLVHRLLMQKSCVGLFRRARVCECGHVHGHEHGHEHGHVRGHEHGHMNDRVQGHVRGHGNDPVRGHVHLTY